MRKWFDLNPTETIAEFVVETSYEDLPQEIGELAKRRILDTIGVIVAGSREPVSHIVCNYVKETGGRPASTALGFNSKFPIQDSALVNGTSAHAMDYDDAMLSSNLLGHPSATVLPAALSVAESLPGGTSGKDLISAYVVGVEVLGRIGSAANPSHYDMGFHSTSTIGALGAACAAGKLLHLDKDQIICALGISASMSSGLRGNFGTMTKPLHAGLAARNGVMAGILAKSGLSSSRDILGSENGFFSAFSKVPNLEKLRESHPGDFHIYTITVKPYPSCAATHAIIDSVTRIRDKESLGFQDVSSIVIEVSKLNAEVLKFNLPKNGLEGKFSAHYCAASALLRGRAHISDFEEPNVTNQEAMKIESKVQLKVNEKLFPHSSMGATVTIETTHGEKYSLTCLEPPGSPKNPLGDQELVAKYRECTTGILDKRAIDESLDRILALEKNDVGTLIEVLTKLDRG